jgi:Domain of unknown function (DUF5615)
MLRMATDADVNGDLLGALRRHLPAVDVVRVQGVGLRTAPDPDILAWAASEGRVLLSQDHSTMPGFARDRIAAGLPMTGLIVLPDPAGRIGAVMRDVMTCAVCSEQAEWIDRIEFLPL